MIQNKCLIIIIILQILYAEKGFCRKNGGMICLQCGGEKYEGNIRLSRDKCCNSAPILCEHGHVCLRARVYSPYGNFFLSGCHPEEDNLTGCDFHSLPHNSSVRRCVCHDDECQNQFPGDCPIPGITDFSTQKVATTTNAIQFIPSTARTLLLSDWKHLKSNHTSNGPRGRHHHNHSKTNSQNQIIMSFHIIISGLLSLKACGIF